MTKTNVIFSFFWSVVNSNCVFDLSFLSSAARGSSNNNNLGFFIKHLPRATRCCSPPDNCLILLFNKCSIDKSSAIFLTFISISFWVKFSFIPKAKLLNTFK